MHKIILFCFFVFISTLLCFVRQFVGKTFGYQTKNIICSPDVWSRWWGSKSILDPNLRLEMKGKNKLLNRSLTVKIQSLYCVFLWVIHTNSIFSCVSSSMIHKDNLKYEDDIKNEDNLKIEDGFKDINKTWSLVSNSNLINPLH